MVKGGLAIRHVLSFHINLMHDNCTGETQPNALQLHKGKTTIAKPPFTKPPFCELPMAERVFGVPGMFGSGFAVAFGGVRRRTDVSLVFG